MLPTAPPRPVRYVFGPYVLSTRRRELRAAGRVQPLIPRYFDLLVFLVVRRADAVHRRDIFEGVWTDVIVSDSALSQAIRTLRRVLEDDSRDPRFIRTVARYGYQFVYADVREEHDDGVPAEPPEMAAGGPRALADAVAVDEGTPRVDDDAGALVRASLERLRRSGASEADREDQRDLAERLHGHGPVVLAALAALPDGAHARALLRDARWDVATPLPVPVTDARTAWQIVRLRLTRARALVASRWASGAAGAGLAGAVAGFGGGLILALAPGSAAPWSVAPVLATIGAVSGAVAGAGVGAGLAVGEAVWRSHRGVALVAGGACGGLTAGLSAQWLMRWSLAALAGRTVPVGGSLEGLAIGAVAGLAYATTTYGGGFAAPRGAARTWTVAVVALACGAAALGLSLAGRPLVGGTVHAIASASAGAQVVLSPLGRLLGEPEFGPITAGLLSLCEGAAFGAGLARGLTRRP